MKKIWLDTAIEQTRKEKFRREYQNIIGFNFIAFLIYPLKTLRQY